MTPCLQEDARREQEGGEVSLKSRERRKGGVERGVEEALAGAFESKRQTKTKKKRQNDVAAKKTQVSRANRLAKVKK